MTHAQRSSGPSLTAVRVRLAAIATLVVAAATACGMASSDSEAASPGRNDKGSDGGAGGASEPSLNAPSATGVVLVHAAAFPPFRLCFENLPNQVPLPDARVMPEANMVGVEKGSLVRIDPLVAPGKIYVINQKEVKAGIGDTEDVKCGELVAKQGEKTTRSLDEDNHYQVVAEAVNEPLGANRVHVLAITGCGGNNFLGNLGLTSANCGAGWDTTKGNLKAQVVELTPQDKATDKTLPVQLFQMSSAIDAFKGTTGSVTVTFGKLATPAGTPLDKPVETGALFAGGAQTTLSVDQTDPKFYGQNGFRIAVKGASETVTVDQSLATVQELSSSRDLPTSYYLAASNYALLLLGDPDHRAPVDGGPPNPTFDPRQGIHLLAVPVLDPAKADAGAGDAGDAGR